MGILCDLRRRIQPVRLYHRGRFASRLGSRGVPGPLLMLKHNDTRKGALNHSYSAAMITTLIGPMTIHTTFVTGMLNKLAQLLAHGIHRAYDFLRSRSHEERLIHRNRGVREVRNALFIFKIWLLYLTGAICGTLLELWSTPDTGSTVLTLLRVVRDKKRW